MDLQSNTTLLDLHIDVLDLIFKELSQLKDEVNLARAHPLLREAFLFHSRHRFKNISLQNMELSELSFILKWCGKRVISVDCESTKPCNGEMTGEMVRLAGDYCPNLKSLDILITDENVKILEENMMRLKSLNEINIYSLKNNSDINVENLLRTFQQLPNLQTLSLDTNNWQTNYLTPLNNLTHLEHLDIWHFYDPEDIEIFSNLWGNLKSLIIETAPDMYMMLSELCVLLEDLEMRDFSDPDVEGIGYFPKLKNLEFNYMAEEGQNFGLHALTLSDNYNNQLESLVFFRGSITSVESAKRLSELRAVNQMNCFEIESCCIKYIARMSLETLILCKIEKDDLLLLLSECKTLRWLRLGWSIYHDKDFIYKLLDILETNGVQPDKPFDLRVAKTHKKFSENITKLLDSNPKGKLLKVQYVS